MVTFQVYNPNCSANPTDLWLCEVRNNGWIADWKRFDSETAATNWGNQHKGEIAPAATKAVLDMVFRHANK